MLTTTLYWPKLSPCLHEPSCQHADLTSKKASVISGATNDFCYTAQSGFSSVGSSLKFLRPVAHFPKRHPLSASKWCGGPSRKDERITGSEPYCPNCFQCTYDKWKYSSKWASRFGGTGKRVTPHQDSCRVRVDGQSGFSSSDRSNCVSSGCDACTCAKPCQGYSTTGTCTPRDPDNCNLKLDYRKRRKCYTAEISDVDCKKAGKNTGVRGWEAFYAYNAPHETSANTGYEESEVALIYFLQMYDEVKGQTETFLVVSLSMADNPSGGQCKVKIDSPNMAKKGVEIQLCDDPDECKGYKGNWNPQKGQGTVGTFAWPAHAADGVVMGPIPNENYCLNVQFLDVKGLNKFKIGSYNEDTRDLDFLEYTVTQAKQGFAICGYSCNTYCARLTSCGQCSADPNCGWCDNACVYKSKASSCVSYTAQGQNCPVCAAAKSCDTCVSNPSCGWCHDWGDCSSVTLYQPKTCAQRAEGKCDKTGMATATQPLHNVTA